LRPEHWNSAADLKVALYFGLDEREPDLFEYV
jgi:hypothetical protein